MVLPLNLLGSNISTQTSTVVFILRMDPLIHFREVPRCMYIHSIGTPYGTVCALLRPLTLFSRAYRVFMAYRKPMLSQCFIFLTRKSDISNLRRLPRRAISLYESVMEEDFACFTFFVQDSGLRSTGSILLFRLHMIARSWHAGFRGRRQLESFSPFSVHGSPLRTSLIRQCLHMYSLTLRYTYLPFYFSRRLSGSSSPTLLMQPCMRMLQPCPTA